MPSMVRDVGLDHSVVMIMVRDRIIDRDSVLETIVARVDRLRVVRVLNSTAMTTVAPVVRRPEVHVVRGRRWGEGMIAGVVARRRVVRMVISARRAVGR